jgi:predicted acylesterase/phospholipase RssA
MRAKLKLQLAIQGGGAKIVALMAALKALEAMGDKFEVTRIVGTSAGAIAGAMFASDVGIGNIVHDWEQGKLQDLLDGFVVRPAWGLPRKMAMLHHLTKSTPVWDAAKLHDYLVEVLKKNGEAIGDFKHLAKRKGVKLMVISTNLRNRRPVESTMDEPVVHQLIDSAGLPYLLRKWGDGASPVIVDGGIGDNLPASRLDMHRPDEIPVCIAFEPVIPADSNPQNFTQFSLSLLDTAIDVSTAQSAALVPRTLFLHTDLTTFDFADAVAALRDGRFETIEKQAKVWFEQLHDEIHTLREQQVTSYSVSNLHPWQSDNNVAQAVMAGVWRAVTDQFSHQLLHFHRMQYRATLNCIKASPASDVLTFTVEFEAGPEPLYCYWLGVSNGGASQLTETTTMTIQAIDTGAFVPHVRVPATGPEPDDQYARYEVIFFTPALVAGTRYRLIQKETGTRLLKDLAPKHKDDFGVNPKRALGKVGEVKLIVDIPDEIQNYSIHIKPRLKYDGLEEFEPQDIVKGTEVPHMIGYATHVFKGTGTSGIFAVDIALGLS